MNSKRYTRDELAVLKNITASDISQSIYGFPKVFPKGWHGFEVTQRPRKRKLLTDEELAALSKSEIRRSLMGVPEIPVNSKQPEQPTPQELAVLTNITASDIRQSIYGFPNVVPKGWHGYEVKQLLKSRSQKLLG